MLLSSVRVVGLGPFDDTSLQFGELDAAPRKLAVILGAGGTGKTTLLSCVASTRPGYATALNRTAHREPEHACFALTDWWLGDDDPSRPHTLRIVSPNAVQDEPADAAQFRRREQTLFDRKAQEGGFVLVSFSAARWFSRSPVVLTAPGRTILRYDVRAAPHFDDASRADMARETKQALSYSAIADALASRMGAAAARTDSFDQPMREVVSRLCGLAGYRYIGASATSLEPIFEDERGTLFEFDDLPTNAKHLAAFAALSVKSLQAAWPDSDPRQAEGVVLIDEVGLHQDGQTLSDLVPTLTNCLPRVQWILTTSSPAVALGCDLSEMVALRRYSPAGNVKVNTGPAATLH